MANRTMQAKAIKLRAQKRRYPRRLEIDKRGPLPNFDLLRAAKQGAKGLAHHDGWIVLDNGELVLESKVPVVNPHLSAKAEIDLERIDKQWNKPLFVLHIDNPAQRIRIYFNSRQDRCIVQRVLKHRKEFQLSVTYNSIDDVYFALKHELVEWKITKPFPEQQSSA